MSAQQSFREANTFAARAEQYAIANSQMTALRDLATAIASLAQGLAQLSERLLGPDAPPPKLRRSAEQARIDARVNERLGITLPDPCGVCHGKGYDEDDETRASTCAACHGTGLGVPEARR